MYLITNNKNIIFLTNQKSYENIKKDYFILHYNMISPLNFVCNINLHTNRF